MMLAWPVELAGLADRRREQGRTLGYTAEPVSGHARGQRGQAGGLGRARAGPDRAAERVAQQRHSPPQRRGRRLLPAK